MRNNKKRLDLLLLTLCKSTTLAFKEIIEQIVPQQNEQRTACWSQFGVSSKANISARITEQ